MNARKVVRYSVWPFYIYVFIGFHSSLCLKMWKLLVGSLSHFRYKDSGIMDPGLFSCHFLWLLSSTEFIHWGQLSDRSNSTNLQDLQPGYFLCCFWAFLQLRTDTTTAHVALFLSNEMVVSTATMKSEFPVVFFIEWHVKKIIFSQQSDQRTFFISTI